MFLCIVVMNDNSVRSFRMASITDAMKYTEENYRGLYKGFTVKNLDVQVDVRRLR